MKTGANARAVSVTEDKSTRYHRLRRRADMAGTVSTGLVLLLLVVSGLAVGVRAGLVTALQAVAPSGVVDAAVVVLITTAVLVILQLVDLPFAYFHGFVLERRYGLSPQPAARWWNDQVKAAAVTIVLGVAGSSAVYLFLREAPSSWWALSAATFAVASVGVVKLAPTVLLPLFQTVRPLDRPPLAARLMALAIRARTDVVGVFEWVVSGHTRKANAALAGLGRTRRILLSDTLLADYSEDEIEVVMAHELAHHVHGDLWRALAFQTLLLVTGFFVAHLVLVRAVDVFGYSGLSDPASLPLLLLTGGVWMLLATPLAAAMSRARERAADRYALEVTGNPDAFVSAMRRLARQNLAEERPSGLSRLLLSHPSIDERLDAARAFTRT